MSEISTIERIKNLDTLPPALRDTEAYSIKEDVIKKCGECKSKNEMMAVLDNAYGERINTKYARAYDLTYSEAVQRFINLPLI